MGYLNTYVHIFGIDFNWSALFIRCPWLPNAIGFLCIIFLLVVIYRAIKAPQVSIFGIKIKDTDNKELKEALLKAQTKFEMMNSEAKLKGNIINNIWSMVLATINLMCTDDLARVHQEKDKLLSHILICLSNVLMYDEKENIHKASLFIPVEGNKLRLQYGPAFSPAAIIEFDINDSAVGWSWRTGNIYKCSDVTQDRTYKQLNEEPPEYKSLVCMNIDKGGDKWGTICVDGTNFNSISEDDITYIKIFSVFASMVFLIVDRKTKRGEVSNESTIDKNKALTN